MASVEEVYTALSEVLDPDLGLPILDLGLIYRVEAFEDRVEVDFTLTSPACPVGDLLLEDIRQTVQARTSVENVQVQIVWDPPWSQEMMSDEMKLSLGFPI